MANGSLQSPGDDVTSLSLQGPNVWLRRNGQPRASDALRTPLALRPRAARRASNYPICRLRVL